ncbi:MAG TPA: hypothetical protein HPQ03_10710 [Deltaproteobacteria bacterium]|nr:hypothetical protein [Deltaproteobacteria bacterium]
MRRLKKISIRFIAGFGVLLILSVIFLMLLPQFVNQDFIKTAFQKSISKHLGGKIEFERLDLSFLPSPRLVIRQGNVIINPSSNARFESMRIHLDILSLLTGRTSANEIYIESPLFSVIVPEQPESQKPKRASELRDLFFGTLMPGIEKLAASIAPGQTFFFHNGKVVYVKAGVTVLTLTEVEWALDAKDNDVALNIRGSSNIGDKISFRAIADRSKREMSGKIDITGLQPQELLNTVSADTDFRIGDSKVDLNLTFKSDSFENLAVDINGAMPFLHLHIGGKAVVFEGSRLRGNIRLSRNDLSASLTSLSFKSPRLSLSGEMQMNTAGENIRLKCEGKEIDIASLRKTILDISGEHPDIRDVFNTLQAGRIPTIAVSATGNTLAELGNLDNIVIEGRMTDGDVYIANADMHLSEVNGKALISKGALKGSELKAKFGNSVGKDGTLLLGLKNGDDRFALDINVTADLSQLPPILNRYIENKSFRTELKQIEDFKGKAFGNLKLNRDEGEVKTQVVVSDFAFTTKYRRVPLPLKIMGGSFSYKGKKIDTEGVALSLKSSHFSGIASTFDWAKKPLLKLRLGKSDIVSQEIFSWLLKLENLSSQLKGISNVEGPVGIDHAEIQGDLLRPDRWGFQVDGDVKDVSLKTPTFIDGLRLSNGNFSLNRSQIVLNDLGVGFKDAAVSITGELRDYLGKQPEANIRFEGDIGSTASRWISKLIKLPDALIPYPRMNVKQANLEWMQTGKIKFIGNMTAENGPNIRLDLTKTQETLIINNLSVKDSASDADFRIQLQPDTCNLSFKGNLEKSTIDKLFVNNQLLDGKVAGDFQTLIHMDRPFQFTAEGSLEAERIRVPSQSLKDLKINKVTIEARKNKILVQSADLDWEGRKFEIDGNISLLPKGIRLDIDLSTGGLFWDDIKKRFLSKHKNTGIESEKKKWNLPVSGMVRLTSDYFKFGHYTWNPFHADISLKSNEISVNVLDAKLCNISTPGVLTVAPRGTMLNFWTLADKKSLKESLSCLFPGFWLADGVFDYEGNLSANTIGPFVIQALRGDMELNASDGRIYRFGALAKIFEFINVAELLKFKFPDLNTEGFPYTKITNRWHMEDGKLKLEHGIIDSPSSEIVFEGEIDMVEQKVDMQVVVSPLQAANFIVKNIPIIRDIMDGSIISIPFEVRGDLTNARVTPLPPGSVGKRLINLMGRTLKAPFKLFHLNTQG